MKLVVILLINTMLMACSGNAGKKIDMDSLKGNLPTAPITSPNDTLRLDSTKSDHHE